MSEKENRLGAPISISWDKVDGKDLIIIRDVESKEIMRFQKYIWVNFTPEIRDSILTTTRQHYG